MDKWLSKLESSNWLTHVKDVLTCACVAAQCIDKEGTSLLAPGPSGQHHSENSFGTFTSFSLSSKN